MSPSYLSPFLASFLSEYLEEIQILAVIMVVTV